MVRRSNSHSRRRRPRLAAPPGKLALVVAICAILTFSPTSAAPGDLPLAHTFARPEDQKRARLLRAPCEKADIGHGCYAFNGQVWRAMPCSYLIGSNSFGSLPTDQCYKMDPPRRFKGIWVDEFEGQQFIPSDVSVPDGAAGGAKSRGRSNVADRARPARIWIDASRVSTGQPRRGAGRYFIDFVGRKTTYPGAHGHFGMSDHEIIVDRLIKLRPCSASGSCR